MDIECRDVVFILQVYILTLTHGNVKNINMAIHYVTKVTHNNTTFSKHSNGLAIVIVCQWYFDDMTQVYAICVILKCLILFILFAY